MPFSRQSSFGGGEFAPSLWGRTDIPRYAVGLRRCRNFYVTNTGSLQNRGGFAYAGPNANNGYPGWLIPFQYSDTTGYLLELNNNLLHVWYEGARLTSVELTTPWYSYDEPKLRYVQSGDVMTFTHPEHPPQVLKRLGHTSWTLTPLAFARPAPYFQGDEPALVNPLPPSDATHPTRPWGWRVTMLGELPDGTRFESSPYAVHLIKLVGGGFASVGVYSDVAIYSDPGHWVKLAWAWAGTWATLPYRVTGFRVYRGRGSLFGLVGETATAEFVDEGEEPDYGTPPPEGRNPFEVYTYPPGPPGTAGTLARTERPICCTYHDERLILGGTAERPATVWGSRVGEYANFDDHLPSTDDEGVELTLAARQREEVRWLLSKGSLLVGTSQNVWSLSAADGGPLMATVLNQARVESSAGCAQLPPLVVGNSVLFVRDRGMGVRELLYSTDARANLTSDVGLLSSHLFDSDNPVIQWAYVEEPHSQVWALRDDGTLLCLTYSRESEMSAWTVHDTQGKVESIACVREYGQDILYAVVQRQLPSGYHRYVERLMRHIPDAEDGLFLDACVGYFGPPITTFTGLSHLVGMEVLMVAEGHVLGPFTVPPSGTLDIPIEGGITQGVVGLSYFSELETLDMYSPQQEVTTRRKSVATVWVEVVASRGLYAGESLEEADDFQAWEPQTVEEGFGPPRTYTGRVEVAVTGRWGVGGRVALQQRLPLPLTVAAVIREVVFGG